MTLTPQPIRPWRECPFVEGATYRVRQDFAAMFDKFHGGELLTFTHNAWSRHDEITGYFFHDATGNLRRWDIADDDDVGQWTSLFEQVQRPR